MAAETEPASGELLNQYRGYLWMLANIRVVQNLNGKLETSDIVQQTLLRAHAALPQLKDRSPNVLAAWLRQILTAELTDAVRHFRRSKRDIDREHQIAGEIAQSAVGLENWLQADHTSPSMAAQKHEQLILLANALMELPDDQREVVIFKHLRDFTLQQIAEETDRTVPAVAGLLRRGLARLREVLGPV